MGTEIVFNPSPTQTAFLAAVFAGQHKYILFGGSIRGGKTYAVLGAIILLCKKYPGSRWIVVRDSLMNLKLTTIPSFFKLCPINFVKKYNQDTQTVTMVNDSQIVFFGEGWEDDKELLRWRGLECSGFVLEETNEMQEASFYKAIERAGTFIPAHGDKPRPIILLTCNPSKNWVKTLFYDRHVSGTLPRDWLYVPSKITDNPFIMADTDYTDSLKNMPSFEYSVFVEGNWELQAKTGLEFYKGFNADKHTGDCVYDPSLPLHISFDDNVSPYLPCGVFQVKEKEIYMIDEILGRHPENTVEAVCGLFIKKYPPDKHKATVLLYGDATAQKQDTKIEKGSNFFTLIMGYLQAYKISNKVGKSNEGVSMRGSWINAVLEKENGGLKFMIDRRCKHAISDFLMTKESPDGSKFKEMATDPKTKVRSQSVGHLSDLTDYFLTTRFVDVFERYKRGGITGRITTGKNNPSKSLDGW